MSDRDEQTRLLQLPDWLVERRRQNRASAPVSDDAPDTGADGGEAGETMALDISDVPASSTPPQAESNADCETILFSAEEFPQRKELSRSPSARRQRANPDPPTRLLADPRRASAVDWRRLDRVSDRQRHVLNGLSSILPPDSTWDGIEAALAERMSQLIGSAHRVEFLGMDTAMTGGSSVELPDGAWTWASMPPDGRRFVAGAERPLANAWIGAADGDQPIIGDDFQFGILSFLIAEFCTALARQVRWPSARWAVNPLSRRDLLALLLGGELPVMELTFDVTVDDRRGPLRLWLPRRLIRGLSHHLDDTRQGLESPDNAWWANVALSLPVVAARAELRRSEWDRLVIGDIVIAEDHGIAAGSITDGAVSDGAQLVAADQWAVTGQLRAGDDDSWKFEINAATLQCPREPEMDDTSDESTNQQQQGQALDVPVDNAAITLHIRLGSIDMTISELNRLRSGQVLDCNRPVGSPVDLVVQGAKVGSGELVDIDGRLGIRILELLR